MFTKNAVKGHALTSTLCPYAISTSDIGTVGIAKLCELAQNRKQSEKAHQAAQEM